MLEIAQANDAGFAMRGAAVVSRREALDAKDTMAAAGEVVERGAADRAETDHHHIKFRHFTSGPGGGRLS